MGCLVNFQVSLKQHLRLNLVSVTQMGHLNIELGHFGIQTKNKQNKQQNETTTNKTTNNVSATLFKQFFNSDLPVWQKNKAQVDFGSAAYEKKERKQEEIYLVTYLKVGLLSYHFPKNPEVW